MKALKFITLFLIVPLTILSLSSCTKDAGFGGKAKISGKVTYNGDPASGAVVYIAYGTKDATEVFDNSTVADENGNYKIEGLQTGDYFIDAKLTIDKDNFNLKLDSPGYGVTVGEKKGEIALDITVE